MKSKYKYTWSAECPRCDKKLSYEDFICENCNKGHIRMTVIRNSNRGFYRHKSIFFGCDQCEATTGRVSCSCGAEIQDKQIRSIQSLLEWLPFICFLSGVSLGLYFQSWMTFFAFGLLTVIFRLKYFHVKRWLIWSLEGLYSFGSKKVWAAGGRRII